MFIFLKLKHLLQKSTSECNNTTKTLLSDLCMSLSVTTVNNYH